MLDCLIELFASTYPESSAEVPASREAWIQRQRTIDLCDHRTDILTENPQRKCGIGEDGRVVATRLQGPSSEIDTFATMRVGIVAAAIGSQPHVAIRSPGQRRPVTRIACDGLFKEAKSIRELRARRYNHLVGAEIKVVGRQIRGRATDRTCGLRCLQCRLDDSGNAGCDPVLQVEDVFERAVEPVGPQMRAGLGFDQLDGDPHPPACFAHRAFEHVPDCELAPDLLYIDGLALVGEGRIAGDDEEPADAGERGDDLLDHAVREIFLLRVAAHILKRQYRDRRLVG
jgi:hypothetical protein